MTIVPLDEQDAEKLNTIMKKKNLDEMACALNEAMKEMAPKYGITDSDIVTVSNNDDGKTVVRKK